MKVMGRFMIPCCCICGKSADSYDNPKWKYQDFCPEHEFLIINKLREDMNSYQPKVTKTQKYEDSQGSHIVTPAKLVIIKSKEMDSVATKNNVVTGINRKPIIISETEEIKVGDWYYCEEDGEVLQDKVGVESEREEMQHYKILALPEHFSDKHLQAIVDGKMKDDDEVLVKCYKSKVQYYGAEGIEHKVHLNQQNHITIFPAKQKEQECTLGVGDGSGNLFVHGSYESIKKVQSMIFELEELRSKQRVDQQSLEEAAQEYLKKHRNSWQDWIQQQFFETFKAGAEWAKNNNN